ncbi:unnamed protein product [Linum trigynum]|uniref:N-acetyltransferase domain-containing protein n=1 Tax=Linum trigynum TaxID=586398 RepID=A0AAV2GJ58_9ROSI
MMLLRSAAVSSSATAANVRLTAATHSSRTPRRTTNINSLSVKAKYAISNEDLESRGFLLRRTAADLDLDQLNAVFVRVGFPRRDPERIKVALDHTSSLLWVQDKRSGWPVAFARATGDGVFNAIIWDVVVDPSFQGIGLGKAVIERLVDEILEQGIVNIALYSEPRVLGFYRPLGFVADPDGIRGMVFSRRNKK